MIRGFVLTCAVIVFAILTIPVVSASSSRFTQEIAPGDCILTIVSSGNGSQTVGECQNGEPQVTEVEYTASGARFIKGICDSSNTVVLRVLFRGVVYTPNTANSPLTMSGDSWTLAIDEITPQVEAGEYSITVSTDMTDGSTLSSTVIVRLLSQNEGDADPGFTPVVPNAPRTNGYSILYGFTNPLNIANPSLSGSLPNNTIDRTYYDDGTGALAQIPKVLVDTFLLLTGILVICIVSAVSSLWKRRLN